MSGPVFISYASQDAAAAKRIADSLRSIGIEVWFDTEGGLEHGDAWDAKIRRQIRECSLFIALISANTQARSEGYFRIEWELAAERAIGIASGIAFILPILIDATREPDALVPDRFRKVQWTRLPAGEISPAVQAHFLKLWSSRVGVPSPTAAENHARLPGLPAPRPSRRKFYVGGAIAVAVVLGSAAALIYSQRRPEPRSQPPAATAPAPESEARRLAHQAADLSVNRYASTQDDFLTAEGLLKKALELDPNDGEVLAASADLNFMFVNRGFDRSPDRMAAARVQSERALKLLPDSVTALFVHGVVQTRLSSNVDAGAATLRQVIAKAPNHARAKIYLGGVLAFGASDNLGAEALELYAQAAQNREWAPLAYYFEYLYEMSWAHFPAAERAVRSSIAANPSVNPQAALAQVQITWKGNLDEALRELNTVAPGNLSDQRIVWITTIIQLYRRRPDEALAALDRLPDNFIHDSYYTGPKDYLVGRAQSLAGRSVAARIAWENGLAIVDARLKAAPTDTPLHLIRGELLGSLDRKVEAEAEAQAVNEMNRGQISSWDRSIVRIYATMGRADLAVPILKELLARAGKFSQGWPLTRTLLREDPLWDKLRADPGFQALVVEPEHAGPEVNIKP